MPEVAGLVAEVLETFLEVKRYRVVDFGSNLRILEKRPQLISFFRDLDDKLVIDMPVLFFHRQL